MVKLEVAVVAPDWVESWRKSSIWTGISAIPSMRDEEIGEFFLDFGIKATEKDSQFTDSPEWEEWRNALTAVGGHGIASFMGHNPSESAIMALKRHRRLVPREEPSEFSKMAMSHGRIYEPYALAIIKFQWFIDASEVEKPKTTVWSVCFDKPGRTIDVAITPDLYDSSRTVWEVKCPFFGRGHYTCPKEWAKAWLERANPWGKTGYFCQALLYAIFKKAKEFVVAVNFVTEEEKMYIKYFHFDVTPRAKKFMLATLEEICLCEDPKKLMRSKKYKDYVDFLALDSFIHETESNIWALHINGLLEEQSEDDSGQDTYQIPGK